MLPCHEKRKAVPKYQTSQIEIGQKISLFKAFPISRTPSGEPTPAAPQKDDDGGGGDINGDIFDGDDEDLLDLDSDQGNGLKEPDRMLLLTLLLPLLPPLSLVLLRSIIEEVSTDVAPCLSQTISVLIATPDEGALSVDVHRHPTPFAADDNTDAASWGAALAKVGTEPARAMAWVSTNRFAAKSLNWLSKVHQKLFEANRTS